jgi:hypothetical protein
MYQISEILEIARITWGPSVPEVRAVGGALCSSAPSAIWADHSGMASTAIRKPSLTPVLILFFF